MTGCFDTAPCGILTGESISEDIHGNTAVQKSYTDRTEKTGTQTVNYPDSDTAAVSVTQEGLLISSKGKSGHTLTFDYDTLGRRISVTDPRTGTSYTSYNAKGQTESVTDAAGNRTEFIYDAVTGQKRAEKNASGKYTRYQYNARGQITRTWGEAVYPVEYVHDSFGRLSEMRTFRDGTGWESGQWPGTGTPDITKWHYQDSTGLLLSKEYADGKQAGYTYTVAGKLSTRTWARTEAGQPLTTNYVYDPGTGELKTVDYSDDTADITFAYDRLGRQKQITDAAGTRTFTYNNALQPESESITGIYSETLTRTYEDGTGVKGRSSGFLIGNPDSPEYAVTYGYGTEGRFGSVSWNAGSENGLVNYSYVPDSDLLSGYSTDTGMKTVYEYEPHRSLKTSVTNSFAQAGTETVISRYGYFYDSIGRRTSVQNTGTAFAQPGFSRYGYNDRSEVTSSERYRGTEITGLSSPVTEENRAYQYDPIGNRKESVAGTQQALIYETNVLNQYKSISGGDAAAPEYDYDGNILKYKDKICQWNAENRLVSVQPQNPVSGDRKITFLYDYMGRRVRKQVFVHSGTDWNPVPETEKLFVYDGWNVVKETTVTGGAPSAKYYVWGLDLSQSVQGAGGIGGLLCSAENGTVLYYFYDGNGNTAQLINADDGSIAAHYEYDAFGNTVTSYGDYADENPFRFSTKYFDAETGLYYYGFRYYSPELGRWWSRDPVGEKGGSNLYGFVGNNPILYMDPFGLDWKVRIKGAVRIVIGIVGEGAGVAGMGLGGASEGATLGASSAVSVPVMVGSALLVGISTDQIVTGYNELRTGESRVSATEAALGYAGELDREYDVTGKLITLETGIGQFWLVPVTEGLAYGARACSYYLVEVRTARLLRVPNNGILSSGSTNFSWKGDLFFEKNYKLYERILADKYDYIKIAERYNLKPENVLRVKEYLFKPNNPNWAPGRHDVKSWLRLKYGKAKPEDFVLLKHETAERFLKVTYPEKYGKWDFETHMKAHNKAANHWDYELSIEY